MSRIFNIKITTGTSPGPYTAYYNLISGTTICDLYYGGIATGMTYSELTTGDGVPVLVPDETTILYLYNETCNDSINSGPVITPTPTIVAANIPQ